MNLKQVRQLVANQSMAKSTVMDILFTIDELAMYGDIARLREFVNDTILNLLPTIQSQPEEE